jgi:hypothetical protein
MNHQVFMDMDGVLVDFESGVLKYMNETMARLNGNLEDPLYKLARSTAKEIGGWDVEISRWHIARPDSSEQSFPRNYRTRDFMYRLVENDVGLWANLGWEKGGKKLWDYAKNIPGIEILSAPMAEGSREGKYLWVERELGLPRSLVNLSDTKEPFGTHKGKQGLLIDDRDKYINEFVAGGGIAIKHIPDEVDNTIRQLKELGY